MTYQLLEEKARIYARKAIEADTRGDYERAIRYYRRAIEYFTTYLRLYPDSPMSGFYMKLVKEYNKRIKVLREAVERKEPASGGGDGKDVLEDVRITYPGQRPRVTFRDVVDMEEVKRVLRKSVIYPVRRPDLYPLGWPTGILLYGPPGCGKTYIALALANEANAVLIDVSPATIMSKWLGEAEKNVAKIFAKAREIAAKGTPVIIFIDEVDGLLRSYSDEIGGETRVRNQFLMEMDGLQGKGQRLPLFVIGATNKPWLLDIGFIRRFQKRIYVPPPNKETRKQLFSHYIEKIRGKLKVDPGVDLDRLAELTEGYSSHDIEMIVQETVTNVVEEHFEKSGDGSGEPRPITMEDFINTIRHRKPSIDKQVILAYKTWAEKYNTT